MKVRVISSWTHPIKGKILPNGTELDIDSKYFNPAFLEEVKKTKTIKSNK
jgi:hypothetical protein